eukprot:PITA_34284
MLDEMTSLHINKAWDLVKFLDGRKPIRSKWVFKKKTNAEGKVEKYKAQLVVKEQMDVKTTFLHGDLEEEIYMKQHEGFVVKVGNDKLIIQDLKTQLSSKFDMKDLGAANNILVMEIKRYWAKRNLWLNQKHDLHLWLEEEEDKIYSTQIYTFEEIIGGGQQDEDDLIEHLLQIPTPSSLPLEEEVKATLNNHQLDLCLANSNPLQVKTIEFGPEKTLKINPSLYAFEEEKLCNLLRENLEAFTWSYKEMKGVHPSVCTHHIYIKEGCKPIRQPQKRMNPALEDIVKEEMQKLLDAGFIYPILDSEWVSPLVLVPKKNGKWRICVDYKELRKSTKKDHSPYPSLTKCSMAWQGRSSFLSQMDLVGITK